MSKRMRLPSDASALIVAILAVGALGAVIELTVDDVPPPEATIAAGDRFESQTKLCPPQLGGPASLWVATGPEAARVGLEPQQDEIEKVAARSLIRRDSPEGAVDVVGYDAPVAATSSFGSGALGGAGSSACAGLAADHWFFSQGSTILGFDQRIVLYNPYPEEASARMTLYREQGTSAPALLADLSIPANEFEIVDFTEKTKPDLGDVGTEIVVSRGRVVAWRSMVVSGDNRIEGAEFALGTTTPAATWYFPEGVHDDVTFTSVVLLNPSEQEASVRVTVPTSKRLLQPPGLEEIVIPPMTARRVGLQEALRGQDIPPSFGIIIDSTVPVVAERAIATGGDLSGRSSEVGATAPATRWSLPPVTRSPEGDHVSVINPGNKPVTLEVSLAREGKPAFRPEPLQVRIKAGTRAQLNIDGWQGKGPVTALVEASGPVVAERAAYSNRVGDLADAIGVALEGAP